MKFSYNWIRELVDGLDTDPRELSRLITMKTAESEGVEPYGTHLAQVRAVRVLSAEPVSRKNQKAVVDAGDGVEHTVVCGAPNCRAGIVTAWVPPGTRLGDREIGRATINGVESEGMLASAAELGISRDGDGILELEGVAPGATLSLVPDSIIDIDNKSLTHRPDLWGHYGMAREVAAISGRSLRDPLNPGLLPSGTAPVKVAIEDFALCPRYSALVLENVTVGPSPLWLQYRLEAIGLNPISNVVDVTNWVMAELAQPMHAFDAEKLHGDTISVRSAHAGERIAALNGESYDLTTANLVIADSAGPVAVAGVIGGAESAISAGTTRIVLESATFNATSVRKTSAALKLRTDASMRFEKAQDPANTIRGLARALELLQIVCPGVRVVGGVADCCTALPPAPPIELPLAWLFRKLGHTVEPAEVRRILEALEFDVAEHKPGVFTVSVPSWRATKDIAIKDDLVEEVGRMIGYDAITPVAPNVPVRVPPANPQRDFHHELRKAAAAQGFTEVYNYSFLSDDAVRAFGMEPEAHVRVLNPIAADQSLMRLSLVPGVVRNVNDNTRFLDSFRLFEIGFEIHRQAAGLPREIPHLCAAVFARGDNGQFFEARRLADCLAPGCAVQRAAEVRMFEHPARTAEILLGGEVAGRVFELHPQFVEHGRAAILDLDLDVLQRFGGREARYIPLPRYPSSGFDLSIVAGQREPVADIEARLRAFSGSGVDRIEFVREYSGPPLPEGKKSVSFRLTVSAPDRTLSSEEVGEFRSRLIHAMREAGYDLRV